MRTLNLLLLAVLQCWSFHAFSEFSGRCEPANSGSNQDQIIPAYTYPTSGGATAPWNTLYGKTAGAYNSPLKPGLVRYIIMSPSYVTGAIQDSNWVTVDRACARYDLFPTRHGSDRLHRSGLRQ